MLKMLTQFPLDTKYKKVLTEKNKLETGKRVDNLLISGEAGFWWRQTSFQFLPVCVYVCVFLSTHITFLNWHLDMIVGLL